MKTETIKVTMSDGKQVALHKWIPDGEVKAVLQLSHGMADYAMRYDHFARYLCENGFAVYGHDHRGHGETIENEEEKGFLAEKDGFNRVVEDVKEMIEKAKAEFPEKKVVLFGHSFGSFVAQSYIEKYSDKIDICVLCGSAGPQILLTGFGTFLSKAVSLIQGKRKKSNLIHFLTFGSYNKRFSEKASFAWVSSDLEAIKKYENDPLCGFKCTNQFFVDFLSGFTTIHLKKNMAKIRKDLPIFIIAGGEDPVGNYGKSVDKLYRCYKKLGIQDVSMSIYSNQRHELLNEVNKEDVEKDILNWTSARLFKN